MVPRGESDDLVAVGIEDQRVGGNENRTDMIVLHVRERRRNVRDVSHWEPRDLEPQRLSRASKLLRLRISAVVQKGHVRELGYHLLEELELLAVEILREQRQSRNAPSRGARLATSPTRTGSNPALMTIGIVRVASRAARIAIAERATITSTGSCVSSRACSSRRSRSPSA